MSEFDISIDGMDVAMGSGQTILAGCSSQGIETPTLCYGDTLTPKNACRVCVVELEGSRVLVPACSRKAEPGMVIHTKSDRVNQSRKMVLELLGSSVDMSQTDHFEEWCDRYDAHPERLISSDAHTRVNEDPKLDNDLYGRDYSKCILCYKCVDACGEQWQNTFAISVAGRGFKSRISVEFDAPLTDSACVYCGNCVAVCPTGALTPMTEYHMRKVGTFAPERQTETTTVCPYCGVGCNLTLHVQDNEIFKVTSPSDHSVTHGNLCIKGRFGFSHVSINRRGNLPVD